MSDIVDVWAQNDEVADVVRAYPDRFAGLAAVDLNDPVAAVREARRAITDLGFVGVRIVPWLWRLPPNNRRYYPLYVACVELGVPLCTQIGHTGPLFPPEPGRPIWSTSCGAGSCSAPTAHAQPGPVPGARGQAGPGRGGPIALPGRHRPPPLRQPLIHYVATFSRL